MAVVPEGYWVPQLSSKKVGLVANGITYDEQAIWRDHANIRTDIPGATLAWSGDYVTFSSPDFWVTIVPSASSDSPDVVNQWCANRRLDADRCFAKRIGTARYDRTTKNR